MITPISHLPPAMSYPSLAISCLPLAMLAPTHLAFGLLAASLAGLLTGTPPTPAAFACAALGALLPDIDTTSSAIGRLLYPLAAFIEQRFGHRSITHSLAGLTIAALLAYSLLLIADSFRLPFAISHQPFAISHQPSAISYFAFITGYASHLVADSTTKAGIPLFWPSLNFQAVFPGNEDYRLRVGSSAEYLLLAILLPLTTATIPLSQLSLTQALHYLIRDVNSAAGDYQTWAGQYLVWVEIEGRHNLSQKPVHGLFEAIDTAGQTAIIIRDRQGDIYAAGQSRNDEVYVHRIRAIRGRPIRAGIQEVRLTNQPLGDLFSHLAIQPSNHPASHLTTQPSNPLHIQLSKPGFKAGSSPPSVRSSSTTWGSSTAPSAPRAWPARACTRFATSPPKTWPPCGTSTSPARTSSSAPSILSGGDKVRG